MGKSKDLASGNSAAYVETAGDTMSGKLTVQNDQDITGTITHNPSGSGNKYLSLNTASSGDGHILFQRAGSNKFQISSDTSNNLFTWNYAKNGTSHRINTDGSVIAPHQPSFSAYKSDGNVSAGSLLICNGVDHNIGNMYNTSNGRGTVAVAGRYIVSVFLMCENNAAYVNRYYKIQKNGTPIKHVYGSNPNSTHHQWNFFAIIELAANDYISILNDGITMYGNDRKYTTFCMHLLS